jgi:PAS domain S-box-containing protein
VNAQATSDPDRLETAAESSAAVIDPSIDLGLILSSVNAGITVQDRSWRLLYVNEPAARISGFATPEQMLRATREERLGRFELLDETGRPFDPEALPGRRVLRGETPEPTIIGFRLPGGEERWSLVQATAAVLPDGREVAISTFHEVTSRIEEERRIRERERRYREMSEQRRRAEDRLELVLRHMPVGVILVDAPDHRLVFANDAARRLPHLRLRVGDPLHYLGNRGVRSDGTLVGDDDWPLLRAMRGETVTNEVVTIESEAGVRRSYNISAGPMRDRTGQVDLVIETVTDITDRVVAQDRERFLARASEVLASSLDYERTVQAVADLAVPQFADWCIVQVAEEGLARRIAVAHRDPAKVALAIRLSSEYPSEADAPTGPEAIIRTGQPEYVRQIAPELVDAAARDDRHREMLRSLTLRSYISVPLWAAGRVVGVLTLVNGESGRLFEPADVTFAESLAARAAGAIDNARLFREGVRFKRLLDATSDAVLLLDAETRRIDYANRSAVDQLGRASAEVDGTTIDDHLDAADAATIRGAIASLGTGTKEARTETVRLLRSIGDPIPVEVRLQLIEAAGEPHRILAVARDRRERLAVEETLQTLVAAEHARAAELNAVIRAMGEGVFVCDGQGRIILANPAAEDVFPDVEEATYGDILAELDDPDGLAPPLGRPGGPVELRARRGAERWIELSAWPVGPDQPEDVREGTIVVLRDVTEARQRQAVRDTFIGILSHELRTPVTTIFAGAKVLSRPSELSPETRAEIFSDIVVESERLHRLVEDVVAMTRFGDEAGEKDEAGAEPVLLQRVLPSVIASEEDRWPGVNFGVSIPAGLPTVIADPTYVEQVIRNLVSNAAKYGGDGDVTVKVEAAAAEVVVRILDNGPGFPPDEADRLFELFFRSTATSRTAAGAGIGLFVCARLIRAMGGRIWAKNRDGGGAEFGFALRVMEED